MHGLKNPAIVLEALEVHGASLEEHGASLLVGRVVDQNILAQIMSSRWINSRDEVYKAADDRMRFAYVKFQCYEATHPGQSVFYFFSRFRADR